MSVICDYENKCTVRNYLLCWNMCYVCNRNTHSKMKVMKKVTELVDNFVDKKKYDIRATSAGNYVKVERNE